MNILEKIDGFLNEAKTTNRSMLQKDRRKGKMKIKGLKELVPLTQEKIQYYKEQMEKYKDYAENKKWEMSDNDRRGHHNMYNYYKEKLDKGYE